MKLLNTTARVLLFGSLLIGLGGPIQTFAAGPATVSLGSAGNFAILAKSGISTTGTTSITGDIGTSPIGASAITGFGLIMDAGNTFSTSARVTGKVYAADYTAPSPTTMTTAISDMQTAYTDAAGRTLPTTTELGAGNIGGMTLTPGLYKWSTGVTIPSNLTLSGGANDIWIFQIAQDLNISSATQVILMGGAQSSNIFWQVAGQAILGTTSFFNGNILSQTAVILRTGATLNGRALAQTAVTLDANTVTKPTLVLNPTPTPPPTFAPTPVPYSSPTLTPVSSSSPTPTPTPSPTPTPTFAPSLTFAPSITSKWANGTLVKISDGNIVYLVANGELKPFTSAAVFHARGLKFINIQKVLASEIANMAMGTPVAYPDGSLIKGLGATVYVVVNGQKSGIPSLTVFKRLGLSFTKVIKLEDRDLASYQETIIQE